MAFKLVSYIQEARDELRKVVWPTRKETVRNTFVVVGISLLVAAFLGLADYVLNIVLERFIL